MDNFSVYIGLGLIIALIIGMAKTGMPGAGALAVPLIAMVFPGKESAGALLPLLVVGDIFALFWYRKNAHWKKLAKLLPAVAVGMVLAYFALKKIDDDLFLFFLGILVLFMLFLQLVRDRLGLARFYQSGIFAVFVGVLAGFATTVGNAAGPVMNMYLLSQNMKKQDFMGTGAWYFFIINVTKIPVYASLGMINETTLHFDLIMAPVVVMGAVIGRLILKKMRLDVFRILILILTAVAAIRLLLS